MPGVPALAGKVFASKCFFFFLSPFCFFMPSQGKLDPTVLLPDAVFVRRQVDHEESGL